MSECHTKIRGEISQLKLYLMAFQHLFFHPLSTSSYSQYCFFSISKQTATSKTHTIHIATAALSLLSQFPF